MESSHESRASSGIDVLHPPNTARVVLVDDNRELLKIAEQIVQNEFTVAAGFNDGLEFLAEVERLAPDVAVLDITLQGMSGLEIANELSKLRTPPKVIFLTIHEELEFVRAVIAEGAMGYVFKSRMATDLNPAIHSVLMGERFLPPGTE